jgi:hypothetical protein
VGAAEALATGGVGAMDSVALAVVKAVGSAWVGTCAHKREQNTQGRSEVR